MGSLFLRVHRIILTVVIVYHAKAVRMGMSEELAGNYIGIALHHVQIFAVETILEPVKSLAAVMSLINAWWYVSENVNLGNKMYRNSYVQFLQRQSNTAGFFIIFFYFFIIIKRWREVKMRLIGK